MPVTNVGSRWSSGDLIFYEKYVSLGAIGNILTIGDDAVMVGSATNDIDFKVFLGSAAEYVLFDVGNSKLLITKTFTPPSTTYVDTVRINSYPTMISGATTRGLQVLSECLAGTGGAYMVGITGIAEQDSTKHITGVMTAGCFSLINAAANPCLMSALELTWKNTSGTGGTDSPYILLREYSGAGGSKCQNLFDFHDVTVGSASATALICEMGNATTASHVIKFLVDGTPYWILCDSTAPA